MYEIYPISFIFYISQTVVIKVGTSSLLKTDSESGMKVISLGNVSRLVETICNIKKSNRNIVLVTSGEKKLNDKIVHIYILNWYLLSCFCFLDVLCIRNSFNVFNKIDIFWFTY